MAHAFAVDFDPVAWNLPILVKSRYRYDRWCEPREKRNECNFTLQAHSVVHDCYYPTNSIFDAKVLCRLLNQVSNFQMHCQTFEAIDKHISQDGLAGITDMLLRGEENIKSLGSDKQWRRYNFVAPEDQYLHKDMPFHISEIDTRDTSNFKPCFFRQEYKKHDENGHPLYVIVMLERKNDGTADNDLFNYNIKFIGSNNPLTKIVDRIPLCNDELLYKRNMDDYYIQNQEYYEDCKNKICRKIGEKDFNEHFETYNTKVNPHQRKCEIVIDKGDCQYYEYSFLDGINICYRNRCPFYPGNVRYNLVKHDGMVAYDLFRNAFGDKIAGLVKRGQFTPAHWSLVPDVKNPEFIRALNKFSGAEGDIRIDKIRYFDDNGEIEKRKNSLNHHIRHIQNWGATLGYDIFGFWDYDGKAHMIQSPIVTKKDTKDTAVGGQLAGKIDMVTHLAKLKTQLLTNDMNRIEYPAIWVKYPGKTLIDFTEAYSNGDTNDGEHWWVTDEQVNVKYKKPKSESRWIGYRFRCTSLAWRLERAMNDLRAMQTWDDHNFKWAASKIFTGNTDEDIFVDRYNVDYNGVTVLNPKKMKSIICDHYDLHTIEWDQHKSTEILLFNKNNAITGIIYSNNPETIVPHIIAYNTRQR